MNFDKEGSKFEKKKCLCVCVWRGGGRGALKPNLYAKLFFFFFKFLNIFFFLFNFFFFNFFLIYIFLIFFL